MTSDTTSVQHVFTRNPLMKRALGVSSDFWERLDETHDLSVVRQLLPVSCGPACGAMCLRNHHVMVTQSAVALAQGSVLTHDAVRLAEAMNRLAGYQGWRGAFVDVFTNPRQTFTALIAHGPFATTLHTFGMRMSHMVVVDGFDRMERVIMRDPGRGTRYLMLWDEFTRVWEGQTVWRVLP